MDYVIILLSLKEEFDFSKVNSIKTFMDLMLFRKEKRKKKKRVFDNLYINLNGTVTILLTLFITFECVKKMVKVVLLSYEIFIMSGKVFIPEFVVWVKNFNIKKY